MARGDLSEEQWQRLQPLLPPERSGKKGPPYSPHRPVINGILWVLRTSAPWRDLPERYPPHGTCSDRLYRWQRRGIWQRLLQELQGQADAEGKVKWDGAAADSTTVRAHQHAAGARRKPRREGSVPDLPAEPATQTTAQPKREKRGT